MANLTPVGVVAVVEGFNNFTSTLGKMNTSIQDVGGQFADVGAKLAGGAIVAGIGAVTAALGGLVVASKAGMDSLMAWGEQLDRLGDQFGMTGEEASKWTVAMNKVGLSVEEGGQGLNYFTKNLDNVKSSMAEWKPAKTAEQVEALQLRIDDAKEALSRATIKLANAKQPTQEMGWAVEDAQKKLSRLDDEMANATALVPAAEAKLSPFQLALDKLGISAFDSTGAVRSLDSLMPEIMDKFNAMPAGIDASALAMDLFGARGGTKFLDFLRQGSQGLTDAQAMAKAFGLEMSTDGMNAIESYGFALNELNLGLTGVKNQIGIALLPYARDFIELLKGAVPTVVEFARVLGENLGQGLQAIKNLVQSFQAGGITGLVAALGLTPEAQAAVMGFIAGVTELAGVIQGKLAEAFQWVSANAMPMLMQGLNWLTDVGLPAVGQAIDFVIQNWDAFQGAILGVVAGGAVLAAIAVIGGAIAALTSPIGLVIAACAALGAAWATDFLGIRTSLTQFWTQAQPVLQKLWNWLATETPKAIQKLVNYWNDVLMPIFTIISTILLDVVFPVLASLAEVYFVAVTKSIQNMVAVWNTVLFPALQTVANWIKTYLMPVFQALSNFFDAVLGLALRVLAGVWENMLLPAMRKVWDFLKNYLQPAFQFINNNVFVPFENGLKEVAAMLIRAKDKINELASSLNNVRLPSWLQPGSPTPFELGLRGIAGALTQVAGAAMPALTSALSISPSVTPTTMPVLGGRVALPMTTAGGNGGVTVNVQTGDINNGMDTAMLGAFIQREVAAALG